MHQAHTDDAEEGQIALQALGLLEQAVLDFAARLEHLVPDLDAPAFPVPLHLLGGGLEVLDGQVRQQHPADRLAPRGRRLFGRADQGDADRLARARGFGVRSAALGRLDGYLRNAYLDTGGACLAPPVAGNLDRQTAEGGRLTERIEHPYAARAVLGHELAIGARTDQILRAQFLRVRQELEEIRLSIRHRDDRHTRGRTLDRLLERYQPLRTLFLLDRRDLQALDPLLIVFLGDLPSRPDTLAQDPQWYTQGREGERVVHDQAPVMRRVTLADRSQAAGLEVAAVGKEHRILHHQHCTATTGHARSRRFPMRLEDPRRARLGVVEQPIRRLRARPIAARFIDRRGRRLGQLFGGFQQATVQTFVSQVGAA